MCHPQTYSHIRVQVNWRVYYNLLYNKCHLQTQSLSVGGNLKRLDLTGLPVDYTFKSYLLSDATYETICNSTIDTFGHKIEIITDALACCINLDKFRYDYLRKINEQNLKLETGLFVYFKTICAYSSDISYEFCNCLANLKCELKLFIT